MDAVKEILHSVGEFLSTAIKTVGPYLDSAGDIIEKCRVLVFLLGFFGLLLTFLWFFFRYLDKKRLTMPAVAFTLFFFIFLSGNILMISQDKEPSSSRRKTSSKESAAVEQTAEKEQRTEAEEPALPQAAEGEAESEPAATEGEPAQAELEPPQAEGEGAPEEPPGGENGENPG